MQRRARATALVLALALAGSQIASFAHIVLVQHVTCADHGELVEIGQHQQSSLGRNQDSTSIAQAPVEGRGHGHEHCLMAPHRRERTVQSRRIVVCSAVELRDSAAPLAAATPRAPPVALISIAPKTSPPV